jgi:uncharacterized SAM-binding protein YcdF (DUF218 family)
MRSLVGVVLLILAVAYIAGIPLLLNRDDDALPPTADAVVVLAGSGDRLAQAEALFSGGVAKNLVISADRKTNDRRRNHLCRTKPAGVICVYSGAISTADEVPAIARVAEREKWKTIVLVTSRYTLLRADRVFERCGDFRVVEFGVDEPWWRDAVGVPLEWIKLGISETVRRGC